MFNGAPPVPITLRQTDERGEESDQRRVFFKIAFVFDVSQTEALPGVDPAPLAPPIQPLTGDSREHLLAPLEAFATSLGYTVSFEAITGSTGGWCDAQLKRIVIDSAVPANGRVRTLIHELAHALGVDYERYSRAHAAVLDEELLLCFLTTDGENERFFAAVAWRQQAAEHHHRAQVREQIGP